MPENVTFQTSNVETKAETEVLKGIFGTVEGGINTLSALINNLINLAKTNPLWGGVMGIMLIDLMSHKVDVLKWQHTETICSDCGFSLATIYDFVTGAHATHHIQEVQMAGILSGAANIQIAGIILSSFAIEGAGKIISDVTAITDLVGNKQNGSLIQPSVLTLVEGKTDRPVTIDVSKGQ